MLNPGSADLNPVNGITVDDLQPGQSMVGSLRMDPTMKRLMEYLQAFHPGEELSGRLHIFNTFTLRDGNAAYSIRRLKELVDKRLYSVDEAIPPFAELRNHPWVLVGWGLHKVPEKHPLQDARKRWKRGLESAGVTVLGKVHPSDPDLYYFLNPLLKEHKVKVFEYIVQQYKRTFQSASDIAPTGLS